MTGLHHCFTQRVLSHPLTGWVQWKGKRVNQILMWTKEVNPGPFPSELVYLFIGVVKTIKPQECWWLACEFKSYKCICWLCSLFRKWYFNDLYVSILAKTSSGPFAWFVWVGVKSVNQTPEPRPPERKVGKINPPAERDTWSGSHLLIESLCFLLSIKSTRVTAIPQSSAPSR